MTFDTSPLVSPLVSDRPPCDEIRCRPSRTWFGSRILRYMIPVAIAVFALNVLLTQRAGLGAATRAMEGAHWEWVPALLAASAGNCLMAAVVLNAACPRRLRFGRTVAVQVAAAFTNRLAPAGLGGMATNLRYLERSGLERADAASTVGITWGTGVLVHTMVVATVTVLFISEGAHYRLDLPSSGYWLAAGCLITCLMGGAVLARRYLGSHLADVPARVRTNVAGLCHRPRDVGRLVAGSAGMTFAHVVALIVALEAFGCGAAFVSVAIIYLAASGFAAVVPIPGGVGPLETALAAGLVGIGIGSGTAIAAVLVYRLATLWLPVIPGAVTFRWLRRHRVL